MIKNLIKKHIIEGKELKELLLNNEKIIKEIEEIVLTLRDCLKTGHKLLIAGNGGSAADASHFAAEIVGRYKQERKGYPAISLVADTSLLTAWSNDYNFNSLFSRQIESLGKRGDVFIALSTSGNSQNIVCAIEKAKKMGITTISFLGKDGGQAKKISDFSLVIPSNNTPRIQELHVLLIHIITEELENLLTIKNKNIFLDLITQFYKKRALVIGDVMLDKYVWGKIERISPEAPVPIVLVEKENYVLGGAANVANNLIDLGLRVDLIGVIGKDHSEGLLKELLAKKKISHQGLIVDQKRSSTLKIRIMAVNQQLLRVDYEETNQISEQIEKKITAHIKKNISKYEVIVISDYSKGLITKELAKFIIAEADKKKIKVVVDPKPDSIFYYKGAYLVKPNKKEIEQVLHKKIDSDYKNLKEISSKLAGILNSRVVISLGKDGVAVVEKKDFYKIETAAKEVYDVSGAGDTMVAALAAAVSAGADLKTAVNLANICAGVVVGKIGTATCSKDELIKEILS